MTHHHHRQSRAKEAQERAGVPYPFTGAVAWPENPRAHGGHTRVQVCACGATRAVNRNGGEREYGQWQSR